MLVHVDVRGFYDWVPAPPGTVITEADVQSLRAKQTASDAWAIRVECKQDSHHDMGIHELTICQAMATQEKLGRDANREDTIVEVMKASLKHHLAEKHMCEITVHDEGPNEQLYRDVLAALEVPVEQVGSAIERYKAGMPAHELSRYLNVVFKCKPRKKENS